MRRLLAPLPLAFLTLACSAPAPESSAPLEEQQSAIVGGVVDSTYNSVVLLAIEQGGGGICSGSLIAPNLVLTARHCVSQNITEGIGCDIDGNSSNGDHVSSDYLATTIGVYVGTTPAFWAGSPSAKGVKLFHPNGKNLCNNDIALILLDKSITVTPPMAMRLNYSAQIGEKTIAVGYGKTSTNNDFSSGTRHRRENIPVLSVGQDWNFLLGANEFVLGQSTCQGDSGGAILAQDSKAILGVTSRGGNCESGDQRFTRLDAHKTLIENALKEAGAAALLEGKTPPAPTPISATGDGPCTTGSQCAALYCYTPTSTCSALCAPGGGFCPSGTVCKAVPIDISGQTITEQPVCVGYEAADSCDSCRLTKCKTVAEGCYADAACSKMLACVTKCSSQDCYDACAASNSAGASKYADLRTCECSAKCVKPCAGVCGKETGAGGAGGSAGSDPGTEGGAAGDPGSEAGAGGEAGDPGSEAGAAGADAAGAAGAAAGTAGATTAGTGGTTAGAGGVSGPQTQATSSSDSGGCSTSGKPTGSASWLLALASLALLRRRKH